MHPRYAPRGLTGSIAASPPQAWSSDGCASQLRPGVGLRREVVLAQRPLGRGRHVTSLTPRRAFSEPRGTCNARYTNRGRRRAKEKARRSGPVIPSQAATSATGASRPVRTPAAAVCLAPLAHALATVLLPLILHHAAPRTDLLRHRSVAPSRARTGVNPSWSRPPCGAAC
jgi:hypothetical protein